MYRKHLCTKCQAELPPEAPVKPQKRKSKALLRVVKVLFFPVYLVLFPVFSLLFRIVGFVKYRDSHYFNAPYETYQDIKKVPQADRYVPVVDQNGDYVMATYRREFRYRKPEYTYWRLWDNEEEK